MAGLWDWCVSAGLALEYPAIGADLVRLALAAGDLGRARQASDRVAQVAARNDVAWMTGEALRCQGLIEHDTEDLLAAAEAHARGSRPLRLAAACEDAGRAFARHGHAERARPLLDKAAGLYQRSAPPATSLAPKPPCARRASGVVAGAPQPAAVRLAQPHPDRARCRRPGRRRAVQSPDRRPPLRIPPDRADTSRARLRQAGHLRPSPASRRGNPATPPSALVGSGRRLQDFDVAAPSGGLASRRSPVSRVAFIASASAT